MTKEEKKSEMVFKDYYQSLDEESKIALRDRILSETGMSYPSFYYKLANDTFKPLERKLINELISK